MTKSRFQPLFQKKLPKAVAFAEKALKRHKKEWNVAMVAQALVHQIDSTQPNSLITAWHKTRPGTQRTHAAFALEQWLNVHRPELVKEKEPA